MKLKINWGVGIIIFFGVFIAFLTGTLIISSLQNTDLVSTDYYQKELGFQQQIDKSTREKKLTEHLKITQGQSTLALQFPKIQANGISGEITFYRPSDKKLDKTIKIKVTEDNLQVIDIREFSKGLWKLKIDWSSGGATYYNEESVML